MITLEEIGSAAAVLAGVATRTPLLRAAVLEERTGARIHLKAECLQRTGSFKIRGAFHRLSLLSDEERRRGVVAFSSGNHARAVACAARLLGIEATIVMPADAPRTKLAGTRAEGARVRLYDRTRESREDIAAEIAAASGATLVRPYDDLDVVRGQGTCGLEIADELAASGAAIDELWVPASGGGLVAGIAVAMTALAPRTAIFTVEPDGFDDHRRSLAGGDRPEAKPRLVRPGAMRRDERTAKPPSRSHRRSRCETYKAPAGAPSICDGLLAPRPGDLTWEINRGRLAGGLVATDDEVRRAVAFAFLHLRLVLEPSGAVGLAALLARGRELAGRSIGIVLSGGNADPEAVFACLRAHPDP
jgi:threonine dehydratase